MEPQQTTKGGHGALIGSIVIIVVLVIGGVYLFKVTKLNYEQKQKNDILLQETAYPTDPVVQSLSTQSESDEISDIETDLNNTNLDNLTPSQTTTVKK